MKFQTGLFFITLFVLVIGAQAQPQEYKGFDPFRICEYQPSNKIIFAGRVISVERVDARLYNGEVNLKVTIAVEKPFADVLQKDAEIFWNGSGIIDDLKKDDRRIFTATKLTLNNAEVLLSRGWSRRLNELSPADKGILFSDIQAVVKRYPKSPVLFGAVIEKDTSSRAFSTEVYNKFGYDTRYFKPVVGIIIEAKREKDGVAFQTKTNKNGTYIFDNLDDGNYFIYPIPPKEYERLPELFREYRFQNTNYRSLKYQIDKNSCHYGVVFEMRKATSP